jgi:hypothetical protein
MTVLASPPPDGASQDPLLYGPDEPDTPFPGACANLDPKVAEHCRPHTDTRVPDDVLHADADTQCAVARNAVAKHLGASLVPVAVDDGELASCYFVEPERQVQIRFRVEADPIDGIPEVFTVREAEIAGHPGYVEDAPDQKAYRVWVAVSNDPREGGGLSLTIDAGPARRDGQPPADASAKAESIVADVLAAYF